MIRLDFISVSGGLYNSAGTVVFSVSNILDIKHNGTSICDLYFNQNDYSYYQIMIDWKDISAYWDNQSWHSSYTKIWKYGVKIYENNTCIFTGVIFFDRVSINKYRSTFTFEATSTNGFFMRANEDKKTRFTSNDDDTFQDFALLTYYKSKTFLYEDAAMTYKPSFVYDGLDLPVSYNTDLDLPNYNNDFSSWLPQNDPNMINYTELQSYNCIGVFDYAQSDPRRCIFMYKSWYGYSPAAGDNGLYVFEHKLKVYEMSNDTIVTLYDLATFHMQATDFSNILNNYNLYSVVYRADQWLLEASFNYASLDFPGDYSIMRNGDIWQRVGYLTTEYISLLPHQVQYLNAFDVLEKIMLLRQAALVNDAQGNVVCKIRPLILTTAVPVDVDDRYIIDEPVYSGVYTNAGIVENGYNFLNMPGIQKNIIGYFESILSKYKTKMVFSVDNNFTTALDNGMLIRYANHNYTITKLKPDYINYITEIEAYGEV